MSDELLEDDPRIPEHLYHLIVTIFGQPVRLEMESQDAATTAAKQFPEGVCISAVDGTVTYYKDGEIEYDRGNLPNPSQG